MDVVVYAELLPPIRSPPIIVEIREGVRSTPGVKSTSWVRDRQVFLETKGADTEEVVLVHDGKLYEGLSSNFGILENGKLITAPPGTVLAGVTLELITSSCQKLGIPVVHDFPSSSNVKDWEGAFISSTSRGLLPINKILIYDENNIIKSEVHLSTPDTFKKIQELLYGELVNRSTKIEE
eukprot:TRINITY_DN3405_c0_g1_i1.p1 TRINITY_DN3405_c0_g1~~TRINITY_DN3405_c0_g1_i1.p1  ORF type:complete len:180 (-),score=37.14 TRINITY_DN3405_c0_g1_i1:130-669(-)